MKNPKISQEMLKKYKFLHEQEKKCRIEREALRDQLIAMLRHGAVAEPGALNARLQECYAVTLSKTKVIQSLGLKQYEWLRGKIEPTLQTQLKVEDRDIAKGRSHKAPKSKATWMGEPDDDFWA